MYDFNLNMANCSQDYLFMYYRKAYSKVLEQNKKWINYSRLYDNTQKN